MKDVGVLTKAWLALRSAVYWLLSIMVLILVVIGIYLAFPFSISTRYKVGSLWAKFNVWLLKVVCGLSYRVTGAENIPDSSVIILSNHQSTWETYALQAIFPEQTWVLKKELMKVPLFGWGIAMVKPIAIDRKAGRKAVEQLVEQGKRKLDEGRCVVIFPEGTRVLPGEKKRYKLGGAILASHVKQPIIPVAHNAGKFWPRHGFIKWPGEIQVHIGKPIYGYGREPAEIIKEVQEWIEGEYQKMDGDK